MIEATPGAAFEARVVNFPSGLTGTVRVRILDNAGGTFLAPTTAGITEDPAGSGSYVVTLTAPTTAGQFSVMFDQGSVSPSTTAFEDLVVRTSLSAQNEPGTGLISVADLDARQVEYADAAQAQAAIDDASAVARAYVEPVFDSVEAPNAPAAVVAVLVGMVRRVLTNPRGLAQETLGDYSFAAGSNSVATLLPTAREKKLLRKAAAAYAVANDLTVPAFGADGVYMQADLPVPPDSTLEDAQA